MEKMGTETCFRCGNGSVSTFSESLYVVNSVLRHKLNDKIKTETFFCCGNGNEFPFPRGKWKRKPVPVVEMDPFPLSPRVCLWSIVQTIIPPKKGG